ncbi:hypothetical protein C0Q70_10191 [Pomacea canaliculata]|uniref:C2H2-type domain-containing protein n=1 Tax=Pomacea canaliculata TaxID=400727 RepID=A0A2T7PBX7_POMCA|nr:hypothetical protein C0Q70_10191 [Pomacea canaliculata]
MMWNDQFVCLSCRKRFKEKQEFYSHVWNHQHPDREICQQCSFLDLDHVCQKTDETLKEIISNINLIDACILNHVGNPQIREKILKISTPGCCTEPVSIPDADLPVTESETPSTEIQKDNNLQNENNEPSSVCETDSVELALRDTAVAETMNLGLSSQTMASSSVQACISLPVVDNIRSETTGTSGVNASDIAQSESGSKSCEHESGTTISWSSQSNVIQAASTESATDTVDHHCPTSAVVTESSALSQESSEGVPETELPPHDPTTSTVTENSPQVRKDLTGDVNPDTADVSSRATKTDEATMDVPVFIDGDDVQFNVTNRCSPKDVQEPGTLNDEGNSIDSTPFLSLIPNPSITMNTERETVI